MKIRDTRRLCENFEDLKTGEVFSISEDGKFHIKMDGTYQSSAGVFNATCLNNGIPCWCDGDDAVYPVKCELVIE